MESSAVIASGGAEPAASAPPRLGGRGIIAAFMFGHFTHHVTNTLLSPLLPLMRDSFGLTYVQSGLLVSAYSVSQGFSQAPIGMLADRVGSRPIVVNGLLGTGVCCLIIGLTTEYWQLLVALIGLGVVAGTYHAPAASVLARVFEPERRGAALGMHIVGGNLSFFATPLVAAGLAAVTQTWRSPYLYFAVAPLAAGIFLRFVLPRVTEPASHLGEQAGLFGELTQLVRVIGPLVGVAIAFQTVYAAMLAFLALYLVDAHGLDRALAAAMVSLPYIGGLPGSPLGGFVSDRLGRKPVIVFCLVCLGPLLVALASAPVGLVVLLLPIIGLVGSARQPVLEGLLLDRAPAGRQATVLGAYYFVFQELGGLAAPGLGLLAGLVGIAHAFFYAALAAAGVSALVLIFHRKL